MKFKMGKVEKGETELTTYFKEFRKQENEWEFEDENGITYGSLKTG